MNAVTAVELALKKQRLQFRSATLRGEFAAHASALAPVLAAGDAVREGMRWLRRNPEIVVVVGVAALVARPRALFRWLRRVVVTWQAWSRLNGWIERHRIAR